MLGVTLRMMCEASHGYVTEPGTIPNRRGAADATNTGVALFAHLW